MSSRETTLHFELNVLVKFFSVQILYHFKLVFMFLTSSCFCEEVLFNLITNEVRETLKVKTVDTYAQRDDRGWGTLYTVKKNQKLSHKNAIKHKNRGPMNFVTTSRTP